MGSTGKEIVCQTGYGSKIGKKEWYIIDLEIDPNAYLNTKELPEMYIPKNAYTGPPGPVTHAYGESPISSRGNLYYSQAEVDRSVSKGKFEGAKDKSKYQKKGMVGHHGEQFRAWLPIMLLNRTMNDPFYDTTRAKIKYLNSNERKKYEVNIKDGILTHGGKPMDTMGAESLYADVRPEWERSKRIETKPVVTNAWIFAMDPNGSIYAADWVTEYQNGGYYDALRYYGPAPKEIVGFNHSSLVGGEPIAAAGEIVVKKGKLELISNKSGHYEPKPVHIYNFMCELRERDPKFSFKNIKLELISSGNRFQTGIFYSAEEFFNKQGDLTKCKELKKDKAKEEPDITRVPCLTQERNTCGQRAAFNALKLKANPNNPNVAKRAMNDDAGLHAIGPMNIDVYDDYVRDRLDNNNGDDIALISSLQRVRDFVNQPGAYPYDQGEQDLNDWAHKRRLDVVTLVINTRAVEGEADPSLPKAKYGHYIAIQLVRKNKGAANEKVVAYYADSLAAGQSRDNLIKELLKALTPEQ